MKNITLIGLLAAIALISASTYIIVSKKSHPIVHPPVQEPGNFALQLDVCTQITQKNDKTRTVYYLRNQCQDPQNYDITYQLEDGSLEHQYLTCLPKNALAALSISSTLQLKSFAASKC
ncbi:transmembrane protein, putative (macronuclear) [Tetrahymena thermophila SB210]|uniref:Transmembrane protein, putative n=1 Tax=Tetrahymena thermophila (strain SB210) TaxID=312017 RepID=I7M4E5_TETTS|nr:transmembrane protein, putative [Tetrahymena thermophila SB210]EAS06327.1 transmembrane protein, putative [Tetrahymena thermophila SB210]|eukprot:XP_001026572.1 transmembrane protein, putative [Tetrahymena thermophila SB210]